MSSSDLLLSRRDLTFLLHDWLDVTRLTERPRYAEHTRETVDAVLDLAAQVAAERFAPHNRAADTGEPTFDGQRVRTIPQVKAALEAFAETGLLAATMDESVGGLQLPHTVAAAAFAWFQAANVGTSAYPMLTLGNANLLLAHGSAEQIDTWVRPMVEGRFFGTMCLSEPQAGSSLTDLTTRAEPQDDGTYRIVGTKMWISGGDHELAENIVHLVLARIPGAPAGGKGLSLFIVPKFLVNEDGSIGERNDVNCVSIEHKMGIHASPTCVMSYGDDGGAVGYLVGEENQGMRAMFTFMNSARIAVGIQGVALGDAAYQKALQYATERRQGREVGGESKEAAPIIVHPDVRRMLLWMRSHIEAMRGLLSFNAAAIDLSRGLTGEDAERWREIAELLTPVSKAWCTDVGMEVTSLAVQVYGGMGYVEESGVAQHFRDMRIAPIYEGTNGIQAMDLVGRKLPMRMGGVVTDFLGRMRDLDAELAGAGEKFASIRTNLAEAITVLEGATNWILTNGLGAPKDALAGATPYLKVFGTVVGGWTIAKLALAAHQELAQGSDDAAWLEAKITSARFYAEQVLPTAAGFVPQVQAGAGVLYEVDADSLASV